MGMMQRQQAMIDRVFKQQSMIDRAFHQLDRDFDLISPSDLNKGPSLQYEITNNDEVFSISLDVPGVDPANIDVSVLDDVLTLSGSRETETSSYKFKKSFALDPLVVVEQLSANLENGVLLVSAPKDVKKPEEKVKKIPITVGKADVPPTTASADESKEEEEAEESEMSSSEENILDLDDGAAEEEQKEGVTTSQEAAKDEAAL